MALLIVYFMYILPTFALEFNLHVNEISFSNKRMGKKSCFDKEAKSDSEMACFIAVDRVRRK